MDFFEAVEKRRSVRKFLTDPVPEEVMRKSFEAAILAPNSSNTQTWNFYWVRNPEKKSALARICLDQSAARTAAELVVVSANPSLWKRSQPGLLKYVQDVAAHESVVQYYTKLVPFMYRSGFFNLLAPLKFLISFSIGLFRPIMRGPFTVGDNQLVAVKSAALAAENFVLALSAQGYQSCMMEGFDEWRLKCLLKCACRERILMVVAVGKPAERGIWGPRFRLPLSDVLKEL